VQKKQGKKYKKIEKDNTRELMTRQRKNKKRKMRIDFLQSVYLKLQGNIPTFSSWLNGRKARSHQVQAGPSGNEGQSSSNSGI